MLQFSLAMFILWLILTVSLFIGTNAAAFPCHHYSEATPEVHFSWSYPVNISNCLTRISLSFLGSTPTSCHQSLVFNKDPSQRWILKATKTPKTSPPCPRDRLHPVPRMESSNSLQAPFPSLFLSSRMKVKFLSVDSSCSWSMHLIKVTVHSFNTNC